MSKQKREEASRASKLQAIRAGLLKAGVKNLKAYGYPTCTVDNILSDEIFKAFFRSMLEDNLGRAGEVADHEIKKLLMEIGE